MMHSNQDALHVTEFIFQSFSATKYIEFYQMHNTDNSGVKVMLGHLR